MADEIATFVQARGATKRRVAFGVGGAVGAAIGARAKGGEGDDPASKLGPSGLGHLVVGDDELVLYKAKASGLRGKPTDEVLLRKPRSAVASASLDRKALMGILALSFSDGSTWEFDVPRAHLKKAEGVARAFG